ncbi:MAG: hypothetical protein LBU04_01195 [Christensenellaceae bacterium]|jgi:hypothetical protein|nr:hypothetical protein [Christensenellaceae bacterium]
MNNAETLRLDSSHKNELFRKRLLPSLFLFLVVFLTSIVFNYAFGNKNNSKVAYAIGNSFILASRVNNLSHDPATVATITYGKGAGESEEQRISYTVVADVGTILSVIWARSNTQNGEFDFTSSSAIPGNSIRISQVSQSGYYRAKVTFSDNEILYSTITIRAIVNPREISFVKWDNISFTYDGESHIPSAVATDPFMGNIPISLSISGEQTDANVTGESYKAQVNSLDTNYIFAQSVATKSFLINKREMPVDWSGNTFTNGRLELVYTGAPISPRMIAHTLTIDGLSPIPIYANSFTDVNDEIASPSYVAQAIIDPLLASTHVLRNYSLSNDTHLFYIVPLEIDLTWKNINEDGKVSLAFNDQIQYPTPIALFNDINYATVSSDGAYGGKDAGTHTAKAVPSSINFKFADAYDAIELNTIQYDILPIVAPLQWFFMTGDEQATVNIDDNHQFPYQFTYNGGEQLNRIGAGLIDLNGETIMISVQVSTGDRFSNAGVYGLIPYVQMSQTRNYKVEANNPIIYAEILKATAEITLDQYHIEHVYTGDAYSIATRTTGSAPVKFRRNGTVVDNRFRDPDIYILEVFSEENVNYLAVAPMTLTLIINTIAVNSVSGEIDASIEWASGINPNTVLKINEVTVDSMTGYSNLLIRNIDAIYEATLTTPDNEIVKVESPTKLTVKLSDKFSELKQVRVLTLYNGSYVEQTLENKDGYITVQLYENGVYAITSINDTMFVYWWIIVLALVVALAIALLIVWKVRRNKYYDL